METFAKIAIGLLVLALLVNYGRRGTTGAKDWLHAVFIGHRPDSADEGIDLSGYSAGLDNLVQAGNAVTDAARTAASSAAGSSSAPTPSRVPTPASPANGGRPTASPNPASNQRSVL